jgi:hypothetical protein
MNQSCFKKELASLVELKKSDEPDEIIKKEYLRLIKKYHPDLNESENDYCGQCTLVINHVYSELKKTRPGSNKMNTKDKVDTYKTAKGYEFRNHKNQIVRETDKGIFLFKLGFHKLQEARDYLGEHPSVDGFGIEIVFKTSEMIFQGVEYLKECIKTSNDDMWKNEAAEQIKYAFDMNNRITRQVIDNESKGLILMT